MNQHNLTLMGNATRDAEIIELDADKNFVKFGIAINRYQQGQDTEPLFYEIACFSNQPRRVAKAIQKGDVVLVHGIPDIRLYETDAGETKLSRGCIASFIRRYSKPTPAEQVEVVAEELDSEAT